MFDTLCYLELKGILGKFHPQPKKDFLLLMWDGWKVRDLVNSSSMFIDSY